MINSVVFNGRLGRDAEGKELANDNYVLNFSLANTKRFTTRGEKQERTVWLSCAWFGNGARVLGQYMTQGRDITVSGELVENKWTDKNGEQRSRIELVVNNVDLHGSNSDSSEPEVRTKSRPTNKKKQFSFDDVEDGIDWDEED